MAHIAEAARNDVQVVNAVDVTIQDDGCAFPGDTVTLIGADGAERSGASELAAKAGTIPWEIFTGISSRVARHPLR